MSLKPFSFETLENFDEHIQKSIPNYDLLFDSLLRIAEYFRDDTKRIYDLGCSTGKLLSTLEFNGDKIGIDKAKQLFESSLDDKVKYITYDLNNEYIFENACIVFAIFTLQFLKKENRQRLVNNVYNGLCKGGAFIVAEKVYAGDAQIQEIYTFSHYDFKRSKFSEKEILEKENSLRRMLRPQTTAENIDMLKNVGFKVIEPFYKYFNFEAWLCIK